jgi:hypothetical protein
LKKNNARKKRNNANLKKQGRKNDEHFYNRKSSKN